MHIWYGTSEKLWTNCKDETGTGTVLKDSKREKLNKPATDGSLDRHPTQEHSCIHQIKR